MSEKKAKLFRNGRSQAVRLPAEFRFAGDEVYIRRDDVTGEVILSPVVGSWDGFFAARDAALAEARDFLVDRDDRGLRDVFAAKPRAAKKRSRR